MSIKTTIDKYGAIYYEKDGRSKQIGAEISTGSIRLTLTAHMAEILEGFIAEDTIVAAGFLSKDSESKLRALKAALAEALLLKPCFKEKMK